ncbi:MULTISPECIES: pseudouridine synthase [Alphaproteobacteria]|uniref:Pseudouridine synthase n=2 Tax=Alphaproteobacteria TaxID=28211 RepID=A0A512HI28_9HYPH|nr:MULTISPECIES: pseudouridine synthase [Alphaproteobacteria]GEO85103.1 pseudouridine synthase [Ciceribacter naphthalenivorans]GLR24563.1 pseudouridine synthase [Ciceribacter naphthalenivorans]GLT07419.1 pseudouridine synthase [Sphingomonas psychrolutea]
MTFKDKSRRPGPKTSDRGGKPLTRKPSSASDKPAPKMARAQVPAVTDDGVKPERISKLLARAGVASRRDIERMVMEGRVSLNGKVLDTPVVNATFADTIEVDGQPIRGIERTRLWLYHKPAGLVTTNADPEGRSTVFDNLPEELPRVMSIGRLDINTEGLLLLTNDGGLARVLELPTTGWLRRYRVRAYGEIDQAGLDKLKDGIAVDGVLYGSIDATLDRTQGHNVWITMGLREGKNREIKNVLGALGLEVNRLIRISYGPFQLGDLPEGKVIEVRGRMLRDQLGPRLIEEAKANFDAPIFDHSGDDDEDDVASAKARPVKSEWAREEKPRYEGKREDHRERALDRLDTRRDDARGKPQGKRPGDDRRKGDFAGKRETRGDDRRGGGFGDGPDKPQRRTPGSSRTANVWMAPGARPVSEKKAGETAAAEKRPSRARPDGAPDKRYGRTKDGKPTKSANRFDPDRKGKPDYGRPDPGPRVLVSRTRDAEGEWIRAEEPARGRGDEGAKRGFGGRPDRGDRSERLARGGDRPFGDRPRGERSFGDRPRDDRPRDARPRDDRPRGDRPFGDKPRGPRNNDSRPAADRPFGDKPRAPRSADSRPAGDRPFGDKPRGAKPFCGKPAGKSFGGKPGGAKPFSGKPGGRSGGGKPSGGRGPAKGKR